MNRRAQLIGIVGLAAAAALAGCGDDTEGTSSSSSGASSSGESSSSSSSSSSSGAGGAGGAGAMCMPNQMNGGKITGKIDYAGAATMADKLIVVAFKDGMPGVPSGFEFSPAGPTFPYNYTITIGAPAPAGSPLMYGITAYLDIGNNNPMGPGPEDKSAPPSALVAVDECQGATVDLTIAP